MKHLAFVVSLMICAQVFPSGIGGYTGASQRLTSDALSAGTGGITLFKGSSSNSYSHNPASLAFSEERRFDANTVNLSLDRYVYTLNGSIPLPPTARLSFGLIAAGTNDIMARDSRGYEAGLMDDSEMAYLVSFSNRFSDKLAIGLSLKLLTRKLVSEDEWLDLDGSGFGAGLGILFRATETGTLGFAIKDWNASYKWKTQDLFEQGSAYQDQFPMSLAWGWMQRINHFTLALEHDHYFSGANILRFGLLWQGIQGISLNGGTSLEDGVLHPGASLRVERSLIRGLPMHIDVGFVNGVQGEGLRTYLGWGLIF